MFDDVFEKWLSSQLAVKLGADYGKFREYIFAINDRNKKLAQQLDVLQAEIDGTKKICAELANSNKSLASRIEHFEKAEKAERQAETDAVLGAFNKWAANPVTPLPQTAFTFLAGDFHIRAKCPLVPTPDETPWITNRAGAKKYLLPNPALFNPMTNIAELYKMDMTRLKPKGQNRVRVIKPCEMSNEGFVEFPGELELLP